MHRWFEKSVVYQIYPMSFKDSNNDGIGDIQGIISKLDYLKELGVDIIWLCPLYLSPMDDNGYDISDYYEINPLFGTMEDFKNLLIKAHDLDLKIIMDLVVNHTSDEHYYFKEALKGKNNPYRDYYIWRDPVDGGVPNDIGSVFSGPAWEYDKNSQQYYFHLFSKRQPDLNWDNKNLRNEIYNMINYWLDLGIDGFRLDVIDLIGKDIDSKKIGNGPYLYERLYEMYEKCFKGRKIVTVGETPSSSVEMANLLTSSDLPILNMIFNFEHIGLDEVRGKGKWHLKSLDLQELKQVFNHWQVGLYNSGWNSLYWSNHDQPRVVSRFGNDNKYREISSKMLATLLHFMQGTPFIYQGEEIGMTNIVLPDINHYKDVETINMYKEMIEIGWTKEEVMTSIYAKGRDNARTPMQWDSTINGGFTQGQPWLTVNPNFKEINVENSLLDKNSIFYYYQKLITFRKEIECIIYGDYSIVYEDHPQVFSYIRSYEGDNLLVVCNFYEQETEIELNNEKYELLISNYNDVIIKNKIILRPYESFVFRYKT